MCTHVFLSSCLATLNEKSKMNIIVNTLTRLGLSVFVSQSSLLKKIVCNNKIFKTDNFKTIMTNIETIGIKVKSRY